jgi:cell division protease FtsH
MTPKKPKLPLKGSPKPKKNTVIRSILSFTLIAVFVIAGFSGVLNKNKLKKSDEVPFSTLVTDVSAGKIKKIEEDGQKLLVTDNDKDKPNRYSVLPLGASAKEQGLDLSKVEYVAKAQSNGSSALDLALNIGLPILVFVGFFYFLSKQAGSQGNQAMMFGKSKAKLYGTDKKKVKFSEIAGNDHAKQDLQEVVEFLKFPKRFKDLGAKIPKGVLLVGNPGTGKTMLAKAVAGEANVPFFSISGSEFVEMFVGVGASRVRDLFAKAKKSAPCIIFIDEIDAVGRRRGSGTGGGHDEREQTLNQILVEMDGFEGGENVIVLAATNRADVLDPALLRPGRFDRRVYIPLPERADREAILNIHFEGKPLDSNVDIKSISKKTAGMSGADLSNLANESAILAARRKSKTIEDQDVVEAFERVAIGPERKNKAMTEKDKEITAYHEGGHALVGHVLPDADPIHKVTIIPRGGTGGVTWSLEDDESTHQNIKHLKDSIARLTAGRIAEEVIYGRNEVGTGASNDLVRATDIARSMVLEFGMAKSPELRDLAFNEDGDPFGGDSATKTPYSDKTAELIDAEIRSIITEATDRATAVIKSNLGALKAIKEALIEKETLNDKQVAEIFKNTKLPKEAVLS